jgi:hypothetical protein
LLPPITGDARNFHLEEYKQLRTEVTGLLARIELLFRYSMVVAATIFAWLVSNSLGVLASLQVCLKLPKELLWFAWLMPPIFVASAGFMAWVTHQRVGNIGDYLKELEIALGQHEYGWESFLNGRPAVNGRQAMHARVVGSPLTNATARLWWIILGLTLMASGIALCAVFSAAGACPAKP